MQSLIIFSDGFNAYTFPVLMRICFINGLNNGLHWDRVLKMMLVLDPLPK